MYTTTKYIFLRLLKRSLDCDGTVPVELVENIILFYLPIYGNIVSVAYPTEVMEELDTIIGELNELLLEGLEKSNLNPDKKQRIRKEIGEECIAVRDHKVIVKEPCRKPLSRLVEFILDKFDKLKRNRDVSLSGHYVSLIDSSIPWSNVLEEVCKPLPAIVK